MDFLHTLPAIGYPRSAIGFRTPTFGYQQLSVGLQAPTARLLAPGLLDWADRWRRQFMRNLIEDFSYINGQAIG
jgi:hypothetical protein